MKTWDFATKQLDLRWLNHQTLWLNHQKLGFEHWQVGFNHCGLKKQIGDLAGTVVCFISIWQLGNVAIQERWREQQPKMEISCPALGSVAMEHLDLSSCFASFAMVRCSQWRAAIGGERESQKPLSHIFSFWIVILPKLVALWLDFSMVFSHLHRKNMPFLRHFQCLEPRRIPDRLEDSRHSCSWSAGLILMWGALGLWETLQRTKKSRTTGFPGLLTYFNIYKKPWFPLVSKMNYAKMCRVNIKTAWVPSVSSEFSPWNFSGLFGLGTAEPQLGFDFRSSESPGTEGPLELARPLGPRGPTSRATSDFAAHCRVFFYGFWTHNMSFSHWLS